MEENKNNEQIENMTEAAETINEQVIVEETKSPEEKLQEELTAEKDRSLRLFAEFDNFKKRTSKERLELIQTAGKEVVVAMLPVLDDFERALKQMETAQDVAAVKEGVNLVYQKFKTTLEQKGLKEMQAVQQEFNADVHEAITEIPAPTEDLKGKVIDQVEKGYYLFDKIIRFAKVVVGK
ncbi:MAG: nucleotide exchange factor GrpE [Bacteroidota bacterium]|jgi:molecular chaperone GrpE